MIRSTSKQHYELSQHSTATLIQHAAVAIDSGILPVVASPPVDIRVQIGQDAELVRTLRSSSRECHPKRAQVAVIIFENSSNQRLSGACRVFLSRKIQCCELSGCLLSSSARRCLSTNSPASSISIYFTSFLRSPRRTSAHTR